MIKWILLFLFLLCPIDAQTILNFEHPIKISINDSTFNPKTGFIDSLKMYYSQNSFYYHIAGAHRDENNVYTILRIPQTLTFRELLIQIILYYNFLPDNQSRKSERVNIYPFFSEIENPAPIRCRYTENGVFIIKVLYWHVLPIPLPPSPEEKDLYNKLINHANKKSYSMDEIDKSIFVEVSSKNQVSLEKLRSIYERVLLWQRSPK
jgi:hypothetical protein